MLRVRVDPERAARDEVRGLLRLAPDATPRRRVVDALYVATDVGTWKLLRRDLRMGRGRATGVIESLVRGDLAQGPE